MTNMLKIAVIAGDGIGKEVVPEGIRVLEAAGRKFGLFYKFQSFDWSCETYTKTGRMMPEDGLDQLRAFDAIFLGAVGFPGVRDHVSLWGLLIPIRRTFQQYVNVRPIRLLKGVDTPLKNRGPADFDFIVVRENTEGEYSEIGGRLYRDTDAELVVQESVFTRRGVDRVLRYAFELAQKRRKHVTSATKSNGIIHTMPYWDERFAAVSKDYPGIKTDQYHIDILTSHFVRHP
ncbi:MAG: tartrate dehydrogenase, partial [Proteobacteria bacterium]|nr:tartrate dehydrogenase [Pseudomonadota bacterium]